MQAAKKAFKTWSVVPYSERQAAVRSFADALEAEKEAFTAMLTQEQGKPVSIQIYERKSYQDKKPLTR